MEKWNNLAVVNDCEFNFAKKFWILMQANFSSVRQHHECHLCIG